MTGNEERGAFRPGYIQDDMKEFIVSYTNSLTDIR